jgi:NitT/TauT family transport system substrate-binding protein
MPAAHEQNKTEREEMGRGGTVMHTARCVLMAALAALATTAGAPAQETTVRVGVVRSVANGALLMAIEKGYFKQFNIAVELEYIDSSANAMALLAQNRLEIVAGGVSAGLFNALEKDLPIKITVDRVTTPIGHNLMIRADLKDRIKEIKDLKGKVIASNAPGSISTYEIGKILEKGGLQYSDVEVKVVPFSQYAVALTNKAVDAALAIPPFTYQFIDRGIAVPFASADELIEPRPLTIAVNLINTDWAKRNDRLVRNYYVALMRGVRDYCQGYHGAPIRSEVIDVLVKSGNESRPELLHQYPWPARNVSGRINAASLLDVQAWYMKHKFTNMQFPIERMVDYSYVDHAEKVLGPFVLEKESGLAGCR